jgi:hypothetical protein
MNGKHVVRTLFILLCIYGLSCTSQVSEPTEPHFGIFLVKTNQTDISESELENHPLITERDIVSYDWQTHTIFLTESGQKKITSAEVGIPFVIVADGQRCYRGAFWSRIRSASYGEPVIDVFQAGRTIQIQRAYPDASFAVGDDPRFDRRIRLALEAAGKLKETLQSIPAGAEDEHR